MLLAALPLTPFLRGNRNGAGKSTLPRVMAGIFEPTHGFTKMKGRVATLLGNSPGMNPDNTGRESISASLALRG
jgi:ABC-type polysaccharide/polyol phosphate transport system ATPase subunit